MNIIQSPAQLEALYERYPLPGPFVFAVDGTGFTLWSHDPNGNTLKVVAEKGNVMQYEEISKKND